MEVEILIVDDDPVACYLSQEILQDAGFSTLILQDSRKVIQLMKELKPRAVILDIMMPGVDGLTLCRAIKGDPDIKDTKVVMASGKAFSVEKDRAMRYGADFFIQKPYNVSDFKKTIVGVVGQPAKPRAAGEAAPAARKPIQVRIWGSRSLPKSLDKLPAGLYTPCVSVETAEHFFIFDAGSGLGPLGEEIAKQNKKEFWIFLTHAHPAHVQGLGLFPPTRTAGVKLHICGPNDPEKSLEDCVRDAFQQSFATNPQPIQANLQLYALQEGDYDLLPTVRISAFYTNHPTTTLGYRMDLGGRSFVYCPDSEIYGASITALQDYDEALGRRCRHADLLIHDARYNPQDYEKHKKEGHSCALDVLDFALKEEIEQLVLFHLDSSYSSSDLDAVAEQARQHLQAKSSNLSFQIGKEGMTISL